jgi:uncharacterized HAD superfamily protein
MKNQQLPVVTIINRESGNHRISYHKTSHPPFSEKTEVYLKKEGELYTGLGITSCPF